jgi:glutaminase
MKTFILGTIFGIVIATSGGRIYEIGDTRKEFTIQSISKPFIYALALKTLSFDFMASKIDVEPSGEAFNAISLDPDSHSSTLGAAEMLAFSLN